MSASFDELWCGDCGRSHEGLCKKHGALHKVQDAAIPTRARLTLPPSLTLKTVKENGKICVGVYSKKIIPVRSQFGPLDAPVISKTKIESQPKKETTVWKKKHAMQKALETSGQSQTSELSDVSVSMTSDTQTSPVIGTIHSHKIPHNSALESTGLHTSDLHMNSLQQQLISMSSQIISQSGGQDTSLHSLQAGLNPLPLHSSPIHGHTNLNQLQQSLQEFPPIGFPSPGGLNIHVAPDNLHTLQQFNQYGQPSDLNTVQHSLNLNGYATSTPVSSHLIGSEQHHASISLQESPPHTVDSQSAEDSGVVDTSHTNLSDSLDVISDADLEESTDQDLTFEIKVVTDDGYVETMDTLDEEHSNWMIFVRPARTIMEQNLIAYQEDGNIFFVSLKPIPTNTELKVWYSGDYAKSIGKGLLPDDERLHHEGENLLLCALCNTSFLTSQELEGHPCVVKVKGRRKGRPRKYVKPTKTWRAKLEKTRLKESQQKKEIEILTQALETPPPKRGRGRPRIKPQTVKPEKVEKEETKIESPLVITMEFEADNSEEYLPDADDDLDDADHDSLFVDKLVIKEKKKRGPKASKSPMTCPHCGISFVAEAAFYIHVYQHTGIKPFICEVESCARGFLSKFKLERHRLIHTCPRHHKCPYCDKSFNRKDHLKNHMITHDPNKKVWRCELCGKEYSYSFSYRTHMAFHSAESGETLECGICKKVYETKETLLFHLKVHTGARAAKNSQEKTHECFECDKKFFTRKDVKRHMITHTKRKDFLCQFCPQRFGRKDHLTRHLRTSHTGDGQTSDGTTGGRVRRSTGDSGSSPVKRRERTLMFEKMEPTMVPLQMNLPTGIQEDIQEQLIAGVTAVAGGSQNMTNLPIPQATLLQNLQFAVSQIPGHPNQTREIQIPAALYEAAAAASAQQQQEQQQQQQQQHQQQSQVAAAASIGNLPPPPGMPTIHTSMPTHYQINEKGYVMNTPQQHEAQQQQQQQSTQQQQPAQQPMMRQIQVTPQTIDCRNLTQSLGGNMYITTATNQAAIQQQQQLLQQQQQQQQQALISPPVPTKIDQQQQSLELGQTNRLVTLQQQQHQQQAEYQARIVSDAINAAGSSTEAAVRPSLVITPAVDPRGNPHSQTYSTILGYMETLRFLENLPTNNAGTIPLQQLQGLNIDMSQTSQPAPTGLAAYGGANNILNINQADLAKGLVTISHPHGATLQLTQQEVKNVVSLAQTVTPQHLAYQQQQQQS